MQMKRFVNDEGQSPNAKEGSTDPFNIYELLNKRDKDVGKFGTDTSIPYPPGFTPVKNSHFQEDQHTEDVEFVRSQSKSEGCNSCIFEGVVNSNLNCSSEGRDKGISRKEGGSILDVLDEMIKGLEKWLATTALTVVADTIDQSFRCKLNS
ncbi:hypothetical protein Tco_0425996 [Tanacetum coccineum]